MKAVYVSIILVAQSPLTFAQSDDADSSGEKKESLTSDERKEQVIKQSKLHYTQQSLALGRHFTNAMQQAQLNGSGLSKDKIKSTAFSALQTKLLSMIEQGGESMIFVDNFLDNLEANKIKMPSGKSMYQTQEGQTLFINVNRAHRTRQNQLDNEEDDEVSTGELKTREFLKQIYAVKVKELSPSEKKAALDELKDAGSRARDARANGEIDKHELVEISGSIRRREEELDGNFQQDPDIDPNFSTARVMDLYGLSETAGESANANGKPRDKKEESTKEIKPTPIQSLMSNAGLGHLETADQQKVMALLTKLTTLQRTDAEIGERARKYLEAQGWTPVQCRIQTVDGIRWFIVQDGIQTSATKDIPFTFPTFLFQAGGYFAKPAIFGGVSDLLDDQGQEHSFMLAKWKKL